MPVRMFLFIFYCITLAWIKRCFINILIFVRGAQNRSCACAYGQNNAGCANVYLYQSAYS